MYSILLYNPNAHTNQAKKAFVQVVRFSLKEGLERERRGATRAVFQCLQFRLDSVASTMADKSTEVEMEEKNVSKNASKKKKKSTGGNSDPRGANAQGMDQSRMSVDSVRYENEDEERGTLLGQFGREERKKPSFSVEPSLQKTCIAFSAKLTTDLA